MLSHCGMAENSGLRTTLVHSNQQGSGPLYKGVRQSVSKKAGPPTETGPANKWLLVKRERERKKEPAFTYATSCITSFCSTFMYMEQLHEECQRETPWAVEKNTSMLSWPFVSLL